MEKMKQWVAALTAAAMLCALVRTLAKGKACSGGVDLACGLFLLLLCLGPLTGGIQLPQWTDFSDLGQEAAAVSEAAQEQAVQELALSIQVQTAAYIENKAADLGAQVSAQVVMGELEGWPRPCSVTITGPVAPSVRSQLSQYMASTLGIEQEAQHWME